MSASDPPREDLWKEYEIYVDLYKHYLKLAIELNVFYYGITGGLLAYYFKNQSVEVIRFALVLPLLMSLIFGFLFTYGAILNKVSRVKIFRIRDALGLQASPEFAVLGWFLAGCAFLTLSVAIGLAALITGCIKL